MSNVVSTNEQLSLDFEPADIKPHYLINQSNELINSKQDLTLTERRIIFSLISLVQPEDETMKTYSLPIKKLADLIGITEKSFYARVERTVDSLQRKVLIFEYIDKQGQRITRKINWIQEATYLRGQGLIRIKLSDALASHFLLKLNSYTKYQLFNVLQLKSDYSWRMYELLKEKQPFKKPRVLRIEELRHLLNIPDDKLKETKALKKVVLEKAKQELKDKTDIYFEYEVHQKIGRKIDSFIFYIHRNEKNIKKHQTKESADFELRNLYNRLMGYGINRKTASDLINKYHPQYIEENLVYALNEQGIRNLTGYIIIAIKDNYAESPFEYDENSYETQLFQFAAGEYGAAIKQQNRMDIQRLAEILAHSNESAKKAAERNDNETLLMLRSSRENSLFKAFEEIRATRDKMEYPNLTEDDFKEEKQDDLIPYLRKWEKQQENLLVDDLPIPVSISIGDNDDDIEDEDLPY